MTSKEQHSPLFLLGIPYQAADNEHVLCYVTHIINEAKQLKIPRYIATVNTDFYANSLSFSAGQGKPSSCLTFLRRNQMNTVDGMPILWLMRLLGDRSISRITGADLLPELLMLSNRHHYSVYFLGNTEDVNDRAKQLIQQRFPHVKIAGFNHSKIDLDRNQEELIAEINRCKPDILFLSLGHPKQELWFQRVKSELKVPISIGIGGSLNFFTGLVPRAPLWMQNAGLEWVYRLYQEPAKLFKRYFVGSFKWLTLSVPVIILSLLQKIKLPRTHQYPHDQVGPNLIYLPPNVRMDTLAVKPSEKALILDFSYVRSFSLDGLGSLYRLALDSDVHTLRIRNIHPFTRMLLKSHRIWDILEPFVLTPDCHQISPLK